MQRCGANTNRGKRCLNSAQGGSRFCDQHANNIDGPLALVVAAGAIIGNAFAPGVGGVVAGAAIGWLAGTEPSPSSSQKRVFVSFDFDNDRALKSFLVGQSKLRDSPFTITDCSLKEAAPATSWERKARAAIRNADLVVVMVGQRTFRASGVLKEIQMAREESIPIVQLIGRRDVHCPAVEGAGHLYRWNWNNLKNLFS